MVLAVLAAGCIKFDSAGRRLVGGAIDTARSRQPTLDSMATALFTNAGAGVDTLHRHVNSALDQLGRQLELVLDRSLDSVEARALRAEDSLAAFIDEKARVRFNRLLSENLALVRDTVRHAVGVWSGGLRAAIDDSIAPALGRSLSGIADSAIGRLSAGLDTNGRLGVALVAMSDRVVRQAVLALADQSQKSTPWWVYALGAAGGLIVISVVGYFVLALKKQVREREEALRLVGRAIQERNDVQLAGRVKALALEHGVEPSLHSFLGQNRLLVEHT